MIEIFTTPICPYCDRAKDLLKRKGVSYVEIDVSTDHAQRELMMSRSHGRRTVPQIFIHGTHVGGCEELYALESEGKLEDILSRH